MEEELFNFKDLQGVSSISISKDIKIKTATDSDFRKVFASNMKSILEEALLFNAQEDAKTLIAARNYVVM